MKLRHAATVLLLTSAACTRVGAGPGPAARPAPVSEAVTPAPAPEYLTGFVTLTGRRVPVSLELLRASGDEVRGVLRIPEMEVEAAGAGRWDGPELVLEMDYGNACAGVVSVRARREGDTRMVGTLGARDCTGEAEGPLSLERRPGGPPQAPRR